MATYELDIRPGDVLVESSEIGLSLLPAADYDLFFGAADVVVTSQDIELKQAGNALLFRPADVSILSSDIQLLLDPYNLKFRPGDVLVEGGLIFLELIQEIRPPAIRPTDRFYTPPQWSYSQLPMEDGGTAGEILCNRPSGPSIDLVFENEDNSIGYDFLDSWSKALGRTKAITVPGPWTQGAKKPLRDLMRNPGTGAVWKYAEKPRVNFDVSPGVCAVTVKIKAVIDGGIASP